MQLRRRNAAVVLTVFGLVGSGSGLATASSGPSQPDHDHSTHLQHTASAAGVAAAQARLADRTSLAADNQQALNATKRFRDSVKPESIEKHLAAFDDIARKNNGNRAAGTTGYAASASYVEAVLKQSGYRTKRQYFDFVYEEVKASSLTQNTPAKAALTHNPMSYSPSTGPAGVTADVVAPATITGCTEADYTGTVATGKTVLLQRGVCSFAVKSQMAKKMGAAAAVVYNNVDSALNGTLGEPGDNYVPITGLSKADGEKLAAAVKAGTVNLTFVLDKITEKRRTFNVLAETRAGSADNVVMVGAHLDSVQKGAGVNDNGSGSAAILEVAAQLGKDKKITNKVRFAWWGAEELGLMGSDHYVSDLKTNSPEDLKKIATYLNFDMVGSPNYMIGVYDADQSTYEATATIPKGSAETEAVFTDYFDGQGQAWVDTEFSGRSDYAAFIANGIPASGLFTGAEGRKSKGEQLLFGGVEGEAYDPNYHAAGDDLKNISMRAIDINSDAIAHSVLTLARSTKAINGKG